MFYTNAYIVTTVDSYGKCVYQVRATLVDDCHTGNTVVATLYGTGDLDKFAASLLVDGINRNTRQEYNPDLFPVEV